MVALQVTDHLKLLCNCYNICRSNDDYTKANYRELETRSNNTVCEFSVNNTVIYGIHTV